MTRYDRSKRALDVVGGCMGLLVTAPLQLAIATAVRTQLGAPVLFRQRRPGREGEDFSLLKFRTMLPVDELRHQVRDADRMTKLGRFLRATSLDELPSLWNVIVGDMSFVGPRPLLTEYLDLYTPFQARRHEVRPGITGLAQVAGRNRVSWEDRFVLDVEYVERRSFWLDASILCRTVVTVASGRGVTSADHVTAEPFRGSSQAGTAT
ncbi:sugar transferase [Auraticoccus monumenti]|uniref:Sugar transferase involved in LPS biosynthesis (Colanic, teichoic acid) n=1 Tax=Auraticoccus monumenti TaxID=675864 RepID=A0A1G6RF44_9ACTN|nr:sugar transferase [Auraticoccus monumenti]SDD03003.1 Sugar transferase involved in LPS biosynthesis (colanic, teichoic acid) [Auraticoccus monumenti]